jgi:hypothetical protein
VILVVGILDNNLAGNLLPARLKKKRKKVWMQKKKPSWIHERVVGRYHHFDLFLENLLATHAHVFLCFEKNMVGPAACRLPPAGNHEPIT